MKRSAFFVLLILFTVSLAWGDVTETFDGLTEGSYGNYSYSGFDIVNGLCSSTNARTGNAVRLRNAATSLTYSGLDGNGKDGGVGTISFWYRSWDSSPAAEYFVEVNVNSGGWSTVGSAINTTSTTYAQWSHSLDNANDNILIRVSRTNGERLHVDDFSITDFGGTPTPTIILSETTLTGFTYIEGSGPSAEQSFTVEGSNLTADISIAATANYEISTGTGGSFVATDPVTLTQSAGSVVTTNIYVRLKAGLSIGDYNSETVTATSTDADTKTVTCSGSVTDGSAPQEPTAGDLIITELCGDGADSGSDNGFMEIKNVSENSISLDNVEARYYNSNPGNVSQTVQLSGTIAANGFVIVTQNEPNFNTAYNPVVANFSGSNFYFNGGDDGCDIYHSTSGILDQFNDNGSGQSPWTWEDNSTWERNNPGSGAIKTNWTENVTGNGTPGEDNDTPLPVTLTSFTAVQLQNDMATIMWETASESNMSCFKIYRGQLEVTSVAATNTSETHNYAVQDQDLEAGQTYNYYLEAVEYDGHTETFGPIVLSVNEEVDPEEPPAVDIYETVLRGNFPNPFNPETNIKFSVDEGETGTLEIFSAKGQLIKTVEFESGEHSFNWNANTQASGVYFYKLKSQSYSETKKMILLK